MYQGSLFQISNLQTGKISICDVVIMISFVNVSKTQGGKRKDLQVLHILSSCQAYDKGLRGLYHHGYSLQYNMNFVKIF